MERGQILSRTIIKTEDGSHSLYVPVLDETYHSTHGAKQEAQHIFIQKALDFAALAKSHINILEIGFGTGLNAFLSLQYARQNKVTINYYGVEKYPISEQESQLLNFALDSKENQQLFNKLHQVEWGRSEELVEGFFLRKEQADFRQMLLPKNYFDVVYFDAFGPDVQPELWTENVFQLVYDSMNIGGVLTTYSVKGKVRRAMKAVGFEVDKIPGPPGKREISRAIKK